MEATMQDLMTAKNLGRCARVATAALALAVGAIALASPAQAYWRGGCCGPRFGIGIGIFPPPVYYAPPPPYYYGPPPVVYAAPPPVVVQQTAPTCTNGQWRQADGSVVNGVACLQPNGTWQLTQ
jgi:hypothetical protein